MMTVDGASLRPLTLVPLRAKRPGNPISFENAAGLLVDVTIEPAGDFARRERAVSDLNPVPGNVGSRSVGPRLPYPVKQDVYRRIVKVLQGNGGMPVGAAAGAVLASIADIIRFGRPTFQQSPRFEIHRFFESER